MDTSHDIFAAQGMSKDTVFASFLFSFVTSLSDSKNSKWVGEEGVQRSDVQLCSQLLLVSNRRMTTPVSSSPPTVVHGGIRQGLQSVDSERLRKQSGGGHSSAAHL